jgi:hypothetical protein
VTEHRAEPARGQVPAVACPVSLAAVALDERRLRWQIVVCAWSPGRELGMGHSHSTETSMRRGCSGARPRRRTEVRWTALFGLVMVLSPLSPTFMEAQSRAPAGDRRQATRDSSGSPISSAPVVSSLGAAAAVALPCPLGEGACPTSPRSAPSHRHRAAQSDHGPSLGAHVGWGAVIGGVAGGAAMAYGLLSSDTECICPLHAMVGGAALVGGGVGAAGGFVVYGVRRGRWERRQGAPQ